MPDAYQSLDPNRLTLLYFILSGLDVLNAINKLDNRKENIINWIYSLQVLPDPADSDKYIANCGFRPGPSFGHKYDVNNVGKPLYRFDQGNVAMTFSALNSLKILGDDFSRVNKKGIMGGLKKLQRSDGSFMCADGCENDMRFVYCAASICTLLQDWSGFNIDLAVKYILSCQSYDFAFGQGAGLESHGGPTYCALAALSLMGRLDAIDEYKRRGLEHWLLNRQTSGLNGRINKDPDSCYSFWIGASLQILGKFDMISWNLCKGFLYTCQFVVGGFGRNPTAPPDLLHTYLSYVTFSMMSEPEFLPVDPELNLTERAIQINNFKKVKPRKL